MKKVRKSELKRFPEILIYLLPTKCSHGEHKSLNLKTLTLMYEKEVEKSMVDVFSSRSDMSVEEKEELNENMF